MSPSLRNAFGHWTSLLYSILIVITACAIAVGQNSRATIQGGASDGAKKVAPDTSEYIMDDVYVSANRETSLHPVDTLKPIDIQNMPNLFSNVLSSIKILPGVSSNTELSSTYNVRGGNFDENLIYINGMEVSQPYLVQQGIEQSQSIINENMVETMEFYHGAFPVTLGDKMSSALDVKYYTAESSKFGGEVHADLFDAGLTLHDKTGNFSWRTGIRYAYPELFQKNLQTSGLYHPRYGDFQFLGSYAMPEFGELQMLLITSRNKFEITPQTEFGKITSTYADILPSALAYTGNGMYSNTTTQAGLKLIKPMSDNSLLTTLVTYSRNNEMFSKYFSYNVIDDTPASQSGGSWYSNSKNYDVTDNTLEVNRIDVKSDYIVTSLAHTVKAGVDLRYAELNSALDRATLYNGADSRLHALNSMNQMLHTTFNSVSAYLEDNIFFNTKLSANAGVRLLKYYFNGEILLSPRAGMTYRPNAVHSFVFTWGFYYQPPYFYETCDKDLTTAKSLVAQKDVQYNLSWEYQFRERSKFTAEIFYKDMTKLIPYYVDQLQLTYGNANNYRGTAAGMDLQYEGELVRGMRTWIGYSYLNAQEKDMRKASSYTPRPLDQTHTIRIFLQDHGRTNQNLQVHVLYLVGSGYHYYPMISVPGTSPGSYEIVPDFS
ncbi:MAG TPA: TonB-dependent receptor plug domain-containing protein, partial [Bacteroidota bacterium]|nr:TonB-dependent receptor plug domain-containing protein [Bacteroidota bacterium]